ncbi:MAG: pyridoxal phosphate-dependent aminotransferase [Bryobacteraceae bacterium]
MRFSSRLAWDIPPNPIWRALEERRRRGAPILDLTQSNPTKAGFAYPDAIRRALADPGALVYEPEPAGTRRAREAIVEWYGARGLALVPEQILLASGTSEAYAWLFKLLCDPGDQVLTPRPSYPLFEYLAGLESVRVATYSLRYDGHWWLDWNTLERAAVPRSRAVVIVQPNNPTGSFLAPAEIERLAAFCAQRGFVVISDEVFADYPLEASEVPSLCAQKGAPCFVLGGLSKAVGLPQMKLSWIVVAGPESWRAAALARLELIADTYLSVGTPVQQALPVMLGAGRQVRDQIHARVRGNYQWLRARLSRDLGITLLRADAGWYGILRVPRVRSEEQWCLELLERGVLVQPGYFYDFAEEAWLVVSLLAPPAELEAGIEELTALAAG